MCMWTQSVWLLHLSVSQSVSQCIIPGLGVRAESFPLCVVALSIWWLYCSIRLRNFILLLGCPLWDEVKMWVACALTQTQTQSVLTDACRDQGKAESPLRLCSGQSSCIPQRKIGTKDGRETEPEKEHVCFWYTIYQFVFWYFNGISAFYWIVQ